MRSQRGMTLLGVLVAGVVPAVALAGAASTLESQSAGFVGIPEAVVAQLTRFGECEATAKATAGKPLLVYASSFRFGFETPCAPGSSINRLASSEAGEPRPTYISAAGQTVVWPPRPGTARPAADTVSYFFQTDRATPRTDDFVLMRQLGSARPEPLVRNVLAYPGRPFFQYYYIKSADAGHTNSLPVPANWLPLQHTTVKHGSAADTGLAARIDMFRAVEMNYRITNGRTGAGERVQQVSTVIVLSTSGAKKKPRPCEKEPTFMQVSLSERTPYNFIPDPLVPPSPSDTTTASCTRW